MSIGAAKIKTIYIVADLKELTEYSGRERQVEYSVVDALIKESTEE